MAITYTNNTIIQDEVWNMWSANYYIDYGTSSTTTDCVWGDWVNDTSSSTTFIDHQGTVWREWVADETYETNGSGVVRLVMKDPEYSTEQKRARDTQTKINNIWREIRLKEKAEEQKIAEDTAMALLGELVSEEELSYYKEHGEILVKGKKCDYFIRKGKSVIRVEKEKVVSLCIHLKNQYKYPLSDNTVSLKLMLEDNEEHFNKTANWTTIRSDLVQKEYRDKIMELEKVKAA